ncbi:MAG TPA: ATP-binding protein [Longimicrobiales bacterium]
MERSLRIRTLFLLCGLAAVAIAAAVVYSVGRVAVDTALDGAVDPHRASAVSAALRGAILSGALASLLLVVPVSLWIGDVARRSLAGLRAVLARHGMPPRARWPLAEANALAAMLARVLDDHRRELAPLVRERDELAYLIDSVGEGILQIDPDGRFVRANRTARAMLALPEQVAEQPVSTLVRNGDLRELLDAARRGGAPEPAELTQDDRRILVAAHPLGGREALGAVAVLVDLTPLRRLESVRRDFVANASHELKTPLTSIRGYAETLLADDIPDAIRRQFLETIHENAARLQRIIDDLLDLSRLESGGWRPEVQAVDVATAAEEVWAGLRDRAERKGIAFAIERGDHPAALADPVAVRQILSNLLDNAVRHTPDGGRITVRVAEAPAPAAVEARTTLRGAPPAGRGAAIADALAARRFPMPRAGDDGRRWILTEVADTGSGIPRDALVRVFERFYRVDPARSRAEGGTGLGLAIVKHLVGRMGGDIVAESELGKGATFRFWLPAAASAPVDDVSAFA